jgi:hypothetical protein
MEGDFLENEPPVLVALKRALEIFQLGALEVEKLEGPLLHCTLELTRNSSIASEPCTFVSSTVSVVRYGSASVPSKAVATRAVERVSIFLETFYNTVDELLRDAFHSVGIDETRQSCLHLVSVS